MRTRSPGGLLVVDLDATSAALTIAGARVQSAYGYTTSEPIGPDQLRVYFTVKPLPARAETIGSHTDAGGMIRRTP